MQAPITLVLMAATIATSAAAFQAPALRERLLYKPYAVQHQREWYRCFFHVLIHADWGHLLINMFVLWSFGRHVEVLYPLITSLPVVLAYGALYIGGAFFASLPGLLKHRDDPSYRSLGASGAVASVLFAQILMIPTGTISVFFIQDLPAWVFGILYLVYSAYMDKRGGDHVAHDAHFHGAIFGVIFTAALRPSLALDLGSLQRTLEL